MKIVETYSHLNGLEYLLVHRKALWKQAQKVALWMWLDRKSGKLLGDQEWTADQKNAYYAGR